MMTRKNIASLNSFLVFVIAVVACGSTAWSAQHLVAPGDDWSGLAEKIRPGDEIILMPGRHQEAAFARLVGTADKPITIRGADPEQPATIHAEREGLAIGYGAHLTIKDIAITNATMNGLSLGAKVKAKKSFQDEEADLIRGIVRIENVKISQIGPEGLRHGILLTSVDNVQIENCQFEGWGGSGVEIVACKDIRVLNCKFAGLEGHSQQNGIRARAGSDRVQIRHCKFEHAGETVICMGDASDPAEFNPPLSLENLEEGVFEASRIQVEHCKIIGGGCAMAYIHADDCLARNNTIYRPQSCVIAMRMEHEQEQFTANRRNIFGENIISWHEGDMEQVVNVNEKTEVQTFVLEENLWWEKPDKSAVLNALMTESSTPQIFDVDPKLDDEFMPVEQVATEYGAH